MIREDVHDLPKINSEFIEPYLKRFLIQIIESVAIGLTTPEEARNDPRGVNYFIGSFGSLHANIATNNEYNRFISLSDEQMIEICKEVFK